MKQLLNKKGNGVVILTADEYIKIMDTIYHAKNKIEYAMSDLNTSEELNLKSFTLRDKLEDVHELLFGLDDYLSNGF